VPAALPDNGLHVVPLFSPAQTCIETLSSGGFRTVISGQSVVGAEVGAELVGVLVGALLGVPDGPTLGAIVRKHGFGGRQFEGPPETDLVQMVFSQL